VWGLTLSLGCNSNAALSSTPGKHTAVFAGGCFWGTQAVFERVRGVLKTTAGYAGGSASTATYDQVNQTTGHAEPVEVVYDLLRSPTANFCASSFP
jgi:peptide-methionine (S)-S-oxide reductase